MKIILWLAIFLSVLFLEVVVLPSFFGAAVPSLSIAVLLIGIALQEFRTGFWFAGISGIMRDVLAPQTMAVHTIFFLCLLFAMHFFVTLVQWDEPARRLGALGVGLLAVPLAWILSSALGYFFLGAVIPYATWSDLTSSMAVREVLFAAGWFLVFSWLAIRWAARRRLRRLERLW